MVKRLPSCAQPSPFFLPGLREEILFLIVICPIYFSFHGKVGSGFCPILSQRERRDGARWAPPNGGGHPRAMLAPDASVGKAEKNSDLAVCGKISTSITMVSEGYFADSLFFDFSRSLLDICDSMTSDSFIFLDGSTSGGVIRQFSYFTLNILCQIFEVFYNNSTIYRHCF